MASIGSATTVTAFLLYLVLVYVHIVRETFHTALRQYVKALVDGDTTVQPHPLFASSEAQARAVLSLRLARVIAFAAWVIALTRLFYHASPWTYWAGSLLLGTLGDAFARLLGDWVALHGTRIRGYIMSQGHVLVLLFRPLAWLCQLVGRVLFRLEPTRDTLFALDEEQVVIMAHQGAIQPMRPTEKKLIDNILEFRETIVREIMVPRLDIVALPVTASLKEALGVIVDKGHSRIPVYDGTIDQIVGILYAKDILRYMKEAYPHWPSVPLRDILRPPYYVPETKRVSELLPEMQREKVHLAIVVDEYGGTAGIVTIEDVIEEIVGEIQDEYDREETPIREVAPHVFVADARLDLEDVSDIIGVELPDDIADTLGGFVYALLDRMPRPGDEVEYPPVKLRVEELEGMRISKVRIFVGNVKSRSESHGRLS